MPKNQYLMALRTSAFFAWFREKYGSFLPNGITDFRPKGMFY
jgi:hypothetical protein